MNRRKFIKTTAQGVAYGALLAGMDINALLASPMTQALANASTVTDNVLVLIQLNGGNDGLNTIIPLDQYDNLANARANLLIPETSVLPLTGVTGLGLHPAMTGIRNLYDEGKVAIIQGVGYENQNFSHFRSTDIWFSGSDSNQTLLTGWLGRYLNYEYPNYPVEYPNAEMPDPLAIQIGSMLPLAFMGPTINMGMSISNPTDFYNLVDGIEDPLPSTYAGKELGFIRQIKHKTQAYGEVIKTAANNVTQQASYPSDNKLADQLKIVAKLIKGGLKTRVYMVTLGGFDTHSSQVTSTDVTQGVHADLLTQVSEGVAAFMNDLSYLGIQDRVLTMTFSEFGRRILSNNSLGSDHGAAAPVMIIGSKVNPGIIGTNPQIPTNVTVDDNVTMQFDYRAVYATMLERWLCVPPADSESILLQSYAPLNALNSEVCIDSRTHEINGKAGIALVSNYPNPFARETTVKYLSDGGNVLLQLWDINGRLLTTLEDSQKPKGAYELNIELPYPSGTYYLRYQNGMTMQTRTLVKK